MFGSCQAQGQVGGRGGGGEVGGGDGGGGGQGRVWKGRG